MSFESPDNEKDFPGLYGGDTVSVTEDDLDKQSRFKKEIGKKKDSKKDKKDKGYVMFEAEDSEEETLVSPDEVRSATKLKKAKPTFRFAKKDIFPKSKEKEKDEKKEKEMKKEEKEKEKEKGKEKRKEEKEVKKDKHKVKEKKPKHSRVIAGIPTVSVVTVSDKPVFAMSLAVAVERSKCHDGVELPAILRECIDYIEEYGLDCEGIYRISGVKSKIQQLKEYYNKGVPAYLYEHEPNVVASLLKQFLRELPEPVLTAELMPKFEEASVLKNESAKVEQFSKLIEQLPVPNRLLLSWMIVHMTHIIEHQKANKMTLQNVSIVLSPTLQISHRVLNVLFSHSKALFSDTCIKRYVPPLRPATSKWTLELPDTPAALQEELAKQESLLNQLHEEMKSTHKEDARKAEQLWEVQRVVTQLKRKIKFAQKAAENSEKRRRETEQAKLPPAGVSEIEELNLELRAEPEKSPIGEKRPVIKKSENVCESVEEVEIHKEPKSKNINHSDDDVAEEDEDAKIESADNVASHPGVTSEVHKDDDEIQEPDPDDLPKESVAQQETPSQEAPEDSVVSKEIEESPPRTVIRENIDSESDDEMDDVNLDQSPDEHVIGKRIETVDLSEQTIEIVSNRTEQKQVETIALNVNEKVKEKEVHLKESRKGPAPPPPTTVTTTTTISHAPVSGPIHPHLQVSQELLQPIKLSPHKLPKQGHVDDSEGGDGDEELVIVEISDPHQNRVSFDDTKKFHRDASTDLELQQMLEDEYVLKLEEEELLAIGDELRTKIETEQSEIERLKQEIVELQYLRRDSDLDEYSSSSESSYESEDEEELQEMLTQLISENEELEKKNSELCQKIHDERMACLEVKVQIRLIQQKQQDSENILDTDNPF